MAQDLTHCEPHDRNTIPAEALAIVTVCTTCRERGVAGDGGTHYGDRVGAAVSERLSDALEVQGLAETVAVAGVGCMAGCGHPCAVAVQAPGKAGYLFGDIANEEDINAIATFAGQIIELDDGWCSSLQRPDALRRKTLARLPAPLPAQPLARTVRETAK